MVAIPTRAAMNSPRTPTPNGRLAQTGDLGLSAVGEALSRTARGLANTADRTAAETFAQTQNEFDAAYLPAAQTYDGRTPGFAREQMARFDGMTTAAAEAIEDPDARRAFERLRPQRRAAQFEAAIRVEGQRSGERQREATERTTRIDAINRSTAVGAAYAARFVELRNGFDGSQAGLADTALAAFDEEAEKALASAPEATRDAMAISIASSRASEWMRLQSLEANTRQAWQATTTQKAADALIATVITDPGRYDDALNQLEALAAEQPAQLAEVVRTDFGRELAVARFQGILQGGDWQSVLTEIDSGTWDDRLGSERKAQVRGEALQAQARAQHEAESVQRQLAADSFSDRLSAEVASLENTGATTGLTEADALAAGGPVAAQQFRRQVALSRSVFETTRGLLALPPAEQDRRVASLRPADGAPDYDDRLAAYQRAIGSLTAIRQQQQTDPAAAVQVNETSASLWRQYQGARTPTNAQLWATDALRRQAAMGVPPTARRILPVEEARRVAGLVKDAAGPDVLTALQTASAMVGQFGGHEGQILTELTREGLSPADAAILGVANGDPVRLGDYARARARGNVGLTPTIRRQARSEVVERLAPLLETMRPLVGGVAASDALVSGIETVAAAHVADGMSPERAAREATAAYLSNYRFENGWRMPAALATGNHVVALRSPAERMGNQIRAVGGVTPVGRTSEAAPDAISLGAFRAVTDLVGRAGAGLYAAGREADLDDAYKRSRYADNVASNGRWISTPDDSGLMLVVPGPAGQMVPVVNAAGSGVVMTWAQLLERASRPGRAPERR